MTSTNNWLVFSLVGRGRLITPNSGNGYIAGLVLNAAEIAGKPTLFIWDGSANVDGPSFDMGRYPPPYRLEFSGVGNRLRLRVLNLSTKEQISQQAVMLTRFTEGWAGLWINTRNAPGDTFTMNIDNFFLSGTKP